LINLLSPLSSAKARLVFSLVLFFLWLLFVILVLNPMNEELFTGVNQLAVDNPCIKLVEEDFVANE